MNELGAANELVLRLAAWGLTFLVHGGVVLGAAWLLTWLRPPRSPRGAELLWVGVLVAAICSATLVVVLPAPSIVGSLELNRWGPAPLRWAGGADSGSPMRLQLAPTTGEVHTVEGDPVPVVRRSSERLRAELSIPEGLSPTVLELRSRWTRWAFAGVLTWLGVSLLLAARQLVIALRFRRRLAGRRPVTGPAGERFDRARRAMALKAVRFTAVDGISSPVALPGSEICVPVAALERLSSAELDAVLAHELGHVARRHSLWWPLLALAEVMLWFQPLVRLAGRRLRAAGEARCDAWAVYYTGGRLDLARAIVKVAALRIAEPLPACTAGAHGGGDLTGRVRRLLERQGRSPGKVPTPSDSRRPGRWLAAMLLVATAAWAIAAVVPGVLPPARNGRFEIVSPDPTDEARAVQVSPDFPTPLQE